MKTFSRSFRSSVAVLPRCVIQYKPPTKPPRPAATYNEVKDLSLEAPEEEYRRKAYRRSAQHEGYICSWFWIIEIFSPALRAANTGQPVAKTSSTTSFSQWTWPTAHDVLFFRYQPGTRSSAASGVCAFMTYLDALGASFETPRDL
jgi:hypothetical protein